MNGIQIEISGHSVLRIQKPPLSGYSITEYGPIRHHLCKSLDQLLLENPIASQSRPLVPKDMQFHEAVRRKRAVKGLIVVYHCTALHAAVAKRSLPCVLLILEAFPKTAFEKTTDGLCALHTALRIGDAAIVKVLFRRAPDALSVQSKAGQTPVQLADLISTDPVFLKNLRSHMASERLVPATEAEYKVAALTLLKLSSQDDVRC